MSSALPVLSGREVVRIFETFGWQVARQSASHIIMVKEGEQVTLSVPDHREVAKGTLRSLIRTAGITLQEFVSGLCQPRSNESRSSGKYQRCDYRLP